MLKKILLLLCAMAALHSAAVANSEAEPRSGTGFFITADGYFITSLHVVGLAPRVSLTLFNRGVVRAAVVATDVVHDLALLKAEGNFHALPVTESDTARRGWPVMTVGYPLVNIQGVEPKVTRGIINSLTGIRNNPAMFQIDVPIQLGNSGGPLVTEQGLVIGVIAHRLNAAVILNATGSIPQNVNYAVKSSKLMEFLRGFPHVKAGIALKPRRGLPHFPALTEYVEEATAIVWASSPAAGVNAAPYDFDLLPVADDGEGVVHPAPGMLGGNHDLH